MIENIEMLPLCLPFFVVRGTDRCKLFCRVQDSSTYYLLNASVIDGTPCGADTFDACVSGQCIPAGCDHILGSGMKLGSFIYLESYLNSLTAVLSLFIHFEIILYQDFILIKDWCGICGGDNSTCKEEKGVYNRTVYGYNTVVRIPSGKLKKHFT